MKTKEIDITKDLYLCSPLLNTKCSKTNCYINNGCCCNTVNKEYSQENLIKSLQDINKQLTYLETYSSKEDVFEDMKRRLNNIETIVNKVLKSGDK